MVNVSRPAVIADMDGTLVDVSGIRHHVTGPERDFAAFHAASIDCPPNPGVVAEVREHAALGRDVVVVTSRSRRWERLTSMWLALHDVPTDALFMRRDGDYRPDVEVKRDILAGIRRRWDVRHAIDDNPAVIALWREAAIPVSVVPGWPG
ncbi:hypothetical protein [Saccharopolyspora erythraea]|uniref:phosphatase domain-containing protein n=1 Tax=Saccharopolyspora erythraea TaxID=1836 RepID=UPI0001D3126B|nr:hypothetical protein [Saccharopolyspora erythraea]EQD83230.1 hypothetical protein N599_26355 [Saccharopolyspora erythraea D]